MVRTQVRLTEEQTKALRKMAAVRRVSMAELVRQGVDEMLRSSTAIDADEKRKRALAAAGRYRSGRRDGSSAHDREGLAKFMGK